jgi:hypothetical protein
MQFKKLSFVFLICAAAVLSGCASFRNNELADVGKLPDVSQFKSKPSVFVEPHFYRGEPGSGAPEILTISDKIQEIIGKSLDNSSLFSKYSFNEADKAASDYIIRVDIYNHGNAGLAAVAGFISGFTFGVIPSAATDNYTLDVKLSDKSGTVVSEATNKDSITTWVGLWFIPAMGNTPEKALTGTLDNQLRSVLKKLFESGKLKYTHTGLYNQLAARL